MRSSTGMNTILLVTCLLAGCGSSGGGGGGSGSDQPDDDQPSAQAVTRNVPGYALAVRRIDALVAGQPCTVHIQVTPEEGMAAPQRVESWLGTTYDATAQATQASLVADTTDTYAATMTLPESPDAELSAWVRLVCDDGHVLEAGYYDFTLNKLPQLP